MTDETQLGLIQKYQVTRLNDPDGKHEDCEYFVLDPKHDKFARYALQSYAVYCMLEYPQLANELLAWVASFGFEIPFPLSRE